MRLYLDDQIGKEEFGKEHRPLGEWFKRLSDQLPHLQGEIDFLKNPVAFE